MRCPLCGSDESQVKDSRPSEDGAAIRRRRLCPSCGGRFTTFERVQLRELTIVKRSGRRTPFVGEMLMKALKSLDVVAYVRYASVYRDFQETQDFARFLGEEGLSEESEPEV